MGGKSGKIGTCIRCNCKSGSYIGVRSPEGWVLCKHCSKA